MTSLIAHRGASAEAPENTLAAIQRAIDLQVDCIEADLHLTKDGIPVVIHDCTLTRTTNSKRSVRVEELTLEEIKQLDAGSWFSTDFAGEQVPTLEELLALDRKGVKLMLEIKKGVAAPEELAERIVSQLPEDSSIHLGSFEPPIIRALQKTPFPLIGIVEELPFLQTFLDMGIGHVALWWSIIDLHLIQNLQNDSVTTWVFTVDDVKDARALQAAKVDGIISNNPRLLKELVW